MSIDDKRKVESIKRADIAIHFPQLRYIPAHYKYMYISLKVVLTFSVTLTQSTSACCVVSPNI